jgi:hypothetical protein
MNCKGGAYLSMTHKFGRIEPKFDVGEPGEPTPDDRFTRRRITSACKIGGRCHSHSHAEEAGIPSQLLEVGYLGVSGAERAEEATHGPPGPAARLAQGERWNCLLSLIYLDIVSDRRVLYRS